MSNTSVFRILTQTFHMRKAIAKWVLYQLTEDQRAAPNRSAYGSCTESKDDMLPQPMNTSDMSPPDSDSITYVKGPLHRKYLGTPEVITHLTQVMRNFKKEGSLTRIQHVPNVGRQWHDILEFIYRGSVKCNLSNKFWFWNRPTCTELLQCP